MAYSGAYRPRQPRDSGNEETPPPSQPEPASPPSRRPPPQPDPLNGMVGGLLRKLESIDMETDDLILALILYLMYRESGDKDLLIMLGAMFLS